MPFRNELYYIAPIANLSSIMEKGLLSNCGAKECDHQSFAMEEVQETRDGIIVPNGLPLHEYVNLYFDARNPTMYRIHAHANRLCVLTVSSRVLEIDDVVVSSIHAASPYARYLPAEAISGFDFDRIYALDWRHSNDPSNYYKHKRQKCAEALVPYRIDVDYITGVKVVSQEIKDELIQMGIDEELISIDPHIFFN